MKKIGLIVNPIAGMGGKVALKGTDGFQTLKQAQHLGAVAEAPQKAKLTLNYLAPIRSQVTVLTCAGSMGEDVCKLSGLATVVVYNDSDNKETTWEDTEAAAKAIIEQGAELLLFAGGDGTARNICRAVGKTVPVLGIPAGVKIQSAVFSCDPISAGLLAAKWIKGECNTYQEREVLDLDEEEYRSGHISAQLYGYMNVPYDNRFIQDAKDSTFLIGDEDKNLTSAAEYVVEHLKKDCYYAVGSGSQAKSVSRLLKIDYEVLGVDIIRNGELIEKDVTEQLLWAYAQEGNLRIIVSPIGGQGFIFGRGNHQFSARVLQKVGKENITIIASMAKLKSIKSKRLHIDCGEIPVDSSLKGYYKIVSGYGHITVMQCD